MTRRLVVQIAPAIRDTLGSPDLDVLREHLWAGACQTCRHPLAGGVPALIVDAMTTRARASLHHPPAAPRNGTTTASSRSSAAPA